MHHHGPPRHARAAWCCHSNRLSQIWCGCVWGHVSNQAAEVFLKDGSLNDGPDDEAFLQSLRRSLKTARGAYPPVALAEIYQEFKSLLTMIRRLHLMVVDLGRSRSVSPQVYQDFMNCRVSLDPAGSLNTLPVPISGKDCPFQTRYVFAYRMDNSDRPSYLLWPIRGGNGLTGRSMVRQLF